MHPVQTGSVRLAGGFTLIELLVVIAIIAILPAGGAWTRDVPTHAAQIILSALNNSKGVCIARERPRVLPDGKTAEHGYEMNNVLNKSPLLRGERQTTLGPVARLIESKAGLAATTHSIFRSS